MSRPVVSVRRSTPLREAGTVLADFGTPVCRWSTNPVASSALSRAATYCVPAAD